MISKSYWRNRDRKYWEIGAEWGCLPPVAGHWHQAQTWKGLQTLSRKRISIAWLTCIFYWAKHHWKSMKSYQEKA